MNFKVSIEGQTLDMPEEIAGDDGKLKSALSPYFPGAANAKFMRSEPKDGVITVTVVKQAGTKGLLPAIEPEDQVLRKLIEAPEGMNPVIELDQRLKAGPAMNQATFDMMAEVDSEILEVLEVGEGEIRNMSKTLGQLRESKTQPAPALVPGF